MKGTKFIEIQPGRRAIAKFLRDMDTGKPALEIAREYGRSRAILYNEVFLTNGYCWRIHASTTDQGIKHRKEA